MALRIDDLPPRVPNPESLSCCSCGIVPEEIVPRYVGPNLAGDCPECGGRMGSPSKWLSKSLIGVPKRSVRSSEFDPSVRAAILERDGHRCQWCGRTPKSGIILQVDHIVPVDAGGLSVEDNGLTLCEECNLGKGKQTSLLSQFHSWRSRVTRLVKEDDATGGT